MNLFINRNGQTSGPLDLPTVHAKLRTGELSPTDLAWCEGAPDWQPLQSLLGTPMPASGQVFEQGYMPPYVGEATPDQAPAAPPVQWPTPPTPPTGTPPTTTGPTMGINPWLQAVGALFLLFLLWTGKYFFALLGIPVLIVLLLVSWNAPERLRFLFRGHTNKAAVRGGLGAALLLCFVVTNSAPKAPASQAPSAPVSAGADNGVSREVERRVADAEANALRAEAARKNAQRDKQRLEQRLREEEAKRRQSERDAARLASLPTPTPIDLNRPKQDLFGYHDLKVRVQLSDTGVTFFNDDVFDYTDVTLRLNGGALVHGYQASRQPRLESGRSLFVPYEDFALNSGERFSPYTHKVTYVHVLCDTRYGRGLAALKS